MNLDSSAFVADQELIQALRGRARAVDCEHDRILFLQGDGQVGLYILHSGEVTMTMETASGEEIATMRSEPGSLLGLPAVVGNCPYSMSAYAKEGAKISFVAREDFSELMLSEPKLAMMILRVLANEVRSARLAITGRSKESPNLERQSRGR
jgi:CRP-like cAMP-binding protein